MTYAAVEDQLTAPGAAFEVVHALVDGRPMKVWRNTPPSLQQLFLDSLSAGDAEFVISGADRMTYEGFGRATRRLAAELAAGGVTKGDRVAIVLRNSAEWPVAFFAAVILGAIAAPMNPGWTRRELAAVLADCDPKAAIVEGDRADPFLEARAAAASLTRILVVRGRGERWPGTELLEDHLGPVAGWSSLPHAAPTQAFSEPDDEATLFYTSGTTGTPKAAVGTHRNAVTLILNLAYASARMRAQSGRSDGPPGPRRRRSQRVTLAVNPLFHVSGCHVNLFPTMHRGDKLVFMPMWSPQTALKLIERERVSLVGATPHVVWQLLQHPARDQHDLSSLKALFYGGAPTSAALVREVGERAGLTPGDSWGMTETGGAFLALAGPDYLARPRSCGAPAPVSQVRIVSEDGVSERAIGEMGELWVRGPQVVKGYWRDPKLTAESFHDGWLRTGDLARRDADGFVYIEGRAKDIIIRGAENIHCREVEAVLEEHPAVAEAALVGRAHPTLGEEAVAFVSLRAGMAAAPAELRRFTGERLAAFKTPAQVVVLNDPLPRGATGKVAKGQLASTTQSSGDRGCLTQSDRALILPASQGGD